MKFHYAVLEDCHTARGVVVVIDMLRAFSTATCAYSLAAQEILLVGTVEEALALRVLASKDASHHLDPQKIGFPSHTQYLG